MKRLLTSGDNQYMIGCGAKFMALCVESNNLLKSQQNKVTFENLDTKKITYNKN